MSYKPKTCSEIAVFHIEKGLKKLKKKTITLQEAGLNKWFEKLKKSNPYLYEDLHNEYVNIANKMNAVAFTHD